MIVLEYLIPSTGKRYHHYIRLARYHQNIDLQMGQRHRLQDFEISKVVTEVIKEHQDYFQTHITSEQIKQLVTNISNSLQRGGNTAAAVKQDNSTLRNAKTTVQ